MHPRAVIKHKKGFGQQGFTLAETAIALAVIAIVIGALVPTFLSIRVAEQSRATAQNLQSAMRAVAAFVHSAGCLPCPTDVMNGTAGWGIVRGDTRDNPPSCAACEHAVGHLPFCSLGLLESWRKWAWSLCECAAK
ncbi:MAG: type II secretion system protein [Alphaproteobacteria bacterium]|nr:type II secretion system protein [Alphaproteobacteria bacterium]